VAASFRKTGTGTTLYVAGAKLTHSSVRPDQGDDARFTAQKIVVRQRAQAWPRKFIFGGDRCAFPFQHGRFTCDSTWRNRFAELQFAQHRQNSGVTPSCNLGFFEIERDRRVDI